MEGVVVGSSSLVLLEEVVQVVVQLVAPLLCCTAIPSVLCFCLLCLQHHSLHLYQCQQYCILLLLLLLFIIIKIIIIIIVIVVRIVASKNACYSGSGPSEVRVLAMLQTRLFAFVGVCV